MEITETFVGYFDDNGDIMDVKPQGNNLGEMKAGNGYLFLKLPQYATGISRLEMIDEKGNVFDLTGYVKLI